MVYFRYLGFVVGDCFGDKFLQSLRIAVELQMIVDAA